MMDLTLVTDEQLQRWITERKAQIAEMQVDINREQKVIDTYEAELSRRQLAAYWLANPQLTAVAVGDLLLMTDEFKANRVNYGGISAWLGTAISVTAIYEIDDKMVCSLTGKIAGRDVVGVGSIPLAIAADMRRAFEVRAAAKATFTFPADSPPWGTIVTPPDFKVTITIKPESEDDNE